MPVSRHIAGQGSWCKCTGLFSLRQDRGEGSRWLLDSVKMPLMPFCFLPMQEYHPKAF